MLVLARSRAADSSCKHLTTDVRCWMLVLAATAGFTRTGHTAHSGVDRGLHTLHTAEWTEDWTLHAEWSDWKSLLPT